MNTNPTPSKERLHDLFEYCNGALYWRNCPSSRIPAGSKVGYLGPNGYLTTKVKGTNYQVSRLIWAWHNGHTPTDLVVDHINHDRSDNRIENLRLLTNRENTGNYQKRSLPKNLWLSKWGTYRVSLMKNGKKCHVGCFKTINEAVAAREAFIK